MKAARTIDPEAAIGFVPNLPGAGAKLFLFRGVIFAVVFCSPFFFHLLSYYRLDFNARWNR
jgi:hypothetical protein